METVREEWGSNDPGHPGNRDYSVEQEDSINGSNFMTAGRYNVLRKPAAMVFICFAFAVLAAWAFAGVRSGTVPVGPAAVAGGNPGSSSATEEDSLGVRCGWITDGTGAGRATPGELHQGPCSGHTNGGMTQGDYVPFR